MSEVLGLRTGTEIFISYLNDDDKTVSGYAQLLSLTPELVTFKTDKNVIIIPVSRLLKIKQRRDGGRA